MEISEKLLKNLRDILHFNYRVAKEDRIFVVFDEDCNMTRILKDGFEGLKPEFKYLDFFKFSKDLEGGIIEELSKFKNTNSLVVLIQSTSFRVSKYRWRNELCNVGFKVLEFGQLNKIEDENQINVFINSLTCDLDHYMNISEKLIRLMEKAKTLTFVSEDGSELNYIGPMDKCLKNIGTLWEQTNWTTRFPIGEVISEAKDLKDLEGEMLLYGFPNISHLKTVLVEKPFKCKIKNGLVVSHEGPEEFKALINLIKTENEEGEVFVRELGLGLNRNIKRYDYMAEPMAYERVEGLHFSLGMKHGMYQKKLWPKYGKKFHQKFHIDVFVAVSKILIDDELVFTKEKGYF